jgi:hypothetical protein
MASVFGSKQLPSDMAKLQELFKCVLDQEKLNEADRAVAVNKIRKYQATSMHEKTEKWQNFLQDIDERSRKILDMKNELIERQSEVSKAPSKSLYSYKNSELMSSYEDVTSLLNVPPGKLSSRSKSSRK